MNAETPFFRSRAVTRAIFGTPSDVIERNRQMLINNGARQAVELEALRDAIDAALANDATSMGGLFSTVEGFRILDAFYDLTECDGILPMVREAALDAGVSLEGWK